MFRKKIAFVLVLLFCGLCVTGSDVYAQAVGYSREEIAARERAAMDLGGIKNRNQSVESRMGGNMLMTGTQMIGNKRRDVRSNNSHSAMLRFDQHREVSPPENPTLRLGPWYADIGIGQKIGVQYIRMDGNGVGFITENGRGRYLKDGFDVPMVSTLYLNNYIMITRHIDFSFNVDVSYAYYPFNTQEDTLDINMSDEGVYATFSTEIELTKDMRLMLYDDILYQTDYIDTRGLEDVHGGEQYEHFENTLGADYDWKFTRFDNLSLSVSRRDVISFSENFDDQEGVFYSEFIAYQRELSRFASAGLAGEMSQSLYDVDTRYDINMYDVRTFIVAQLTRKLYGNASLGYSFSTSPDEDYQSDGGMVGSLGLGHQISATRYQEITYDRSQSEAFRGGVDVTDTLRYRYEWDTRYFPGSISSEYTMYSPTGDDRGAYSDWRNSLELQYQLTRRFRLHFDTYYDIRMNDPADEELSSGAPDVSSDYTTWNIRLGTDTPITKKITFNIYVEHTQRFSDNDDLAYTQDAIVAFVDWRHKF